MSNRVWIGNMKGPKGEVGQVGAQGPQGEVGKKGERGSRWSDGVYITGTSTEPTAYPTGILDSLPEDYYLNPETGNIYRCTQGGDENTALWVFVSNIKGAMPDVENSFSSTSRKNALSANAGRILYEKLGAAGIFPKSLRVSCEELIFAIKLLIENRDTHIIIEDIDGNQGLYTYAQAGNEDTAEVVIWIGTAIGLSNGAVIRNIASTDAEILKYELHDEDDEMVYEYRPEVWEVLNELLLSHERTLVVTEEQGEETVSYPAYEFRQDVNGERQLGFPITHAKAIWWDKGKNKTLYDKVQEGLFDESQIICEEEQLLALGEESKGTLVPDAYVFGRFMQYVYNLPAIRSGTAEPNDSVGKDGDIYIMLESDGE